MNPTFVSALICCFLAFPMIANSTITGRITFGSTMFSPSIYSAGTKATAELDIHAKQLLFTVPKFDGQIIFWVLITEPTITYELIDPELSNTIDYLKLPHGQKYRLYRLVFGTDQKWVVEEKVLDETLRIPDQAIIICCNPDFIAGIEESHPSELPTIKMHDDLVSLVGSEVKLHDAINGFVLASIDFDTIHTRAHQGRHLKVAQNKVLIAPPIS